MRFLLLFLLAPLTNWAQEGIPFLLHPQLKENAAGKLYFDVAGEHYNEVFNAAPFTLQNLQGNPQGTDSGILLDFGNNLGEGTLYYGLIPYGETQHPQPVFFKSGLPIKNGKVHLPIRYNLEGKYDMVGWEQSGFGLMGFRVVNADGAILYDGRVQFQGTGPFSIGPTITEGPFIHKITPTSATISFSSLRETDTFEVTSNHQKTILYGQKKYEVVFQNLEANQNYTYQIIAGKHRQFHSYKTAPLPGAMQSFSFAYASDSRKSTGGGERNIYGTNAYIMKKIAALAASKNSAFVQFSGDLVDGYVTDPEEMHLQFANWKRAIEPFAHTTPWYVAFGNHESLSRNFENEKGQLISVDRFPYATESGEVIFAENFVNPENGPISEDGPVYDPNKKQTDFPPYKETVFHYQHGNVAMVVLNSNYWYAVNKKLVEKTSGGLHAYIMDQQLDWFKKTIAKLERDTTVEHIFITLHTPFFPNGGHVKDDMWYDGNNKFRTFVAGKPLEKGIIERRDELLDIIVNQSTKAVAILTGDEHNYAKTEITPNTKIYPSNWKGKELHRKRTIWQINNGAAGAPYYAQESTPWTPQVSGFSTQNALVLIHIDGKSVKLEVINPDTLEILDNLILRQ
jgi:hypothetical protein